MSRLLLRPVAIAAASASFLLAGLVVLPAQDRLRAMPGADQYARMQPLVANVNAALSAGLQTRWADDSRSFTYVIAGRPHRFDLATMSATEAPAAAPGAGRGAAGRGRGIGAAPPAAAAGRGGLEQQQLEMPAAAMQGCPARQTQTARGRQAYCIESPDGRLKAFYRGRNLWVANADGSGERQLTTDGGEAARIKYGTASWVYGEELGQTTAIWWSPDSRKVAFYRFDESQVKDFYVQMRQTEVQGAVDVEAYPKAGAPNPVADVLVYDTSTAAVTRIDARDGRPPDDGVVGHYVYGIEWSRDGTELLLQRANRRQQIIELVACGPSTGRCRVVVREEWTTGWLNAGVDPRLSPAFIPRWLEDGRRFIWESERNGWKNYYLYDLGKGLLHPITTNSTFEAGNIVRIDEARNTLFYTARDGDSYLKVQLHRVGLDGRGDVRLTDPAFTHAVAAASISPDGSYFVDLYQTHAQPPASQLVDARSGKPLARLGSSDMTEYDRAGFRRAEQYSYLAADGKTRLFGQISFPSNFDPAKTYPTLVSVYGGPVLQGSIPTESFAGPDPFAEYGFLTVLVSYRGVPGTGKRAADALYLHLGVAEIDDMAAGIKALWSRPYFDRNRVGIFGTSYGGYTAAMMILRHPDVVSVAAASSPVTDWRHYDSIYTERFMWTPQENARGYDAGSAMTYAGNLRGRLLLYYGTADNNVHQNNSVQLIQALQRAGKSFEVQIGPDRPHSSVDTQRRMEFFIENLVMHPERILAPQ
jgi:dipeptidyl-peptidase-4